LRDLHDAASLSSVSLVVEYRFTAGSGAVLILRRMEMRKNETGSLGRLANVASCSTRVASLLESRGVEVGPLRSS